MSNEPEDVGQVEVEITKTSLPVIELALDKIRVDESKNLRRFSPDAKSINELAESIKTEGLLQPVIVRPIEVNGDGCEYELVAGFRRMEAMKVNEAPVVMARVLGATADATGNKITNLTENRMRAELSYMDQAHAAKELLDAGMKRQDIAKAFGKSPAWATRILKFLELRPKIQKLIHEGKVPFRAAAIMPDLSEEKQDELLTEIERQEKGTPSASEKVDRASQKRKARKKKVAKKVAAKAKKLVAKKLAADPRIKEGEKFKAILLAVVKAHSALADKVKKAKKKATEKDKAMVPVLGALRGYLSGKPLKVFTSAVGKLL
jgi:ParB family chromosome partitioning protein